MIKRLILGKDTTNPTISELAQLILNIKTSVTKASGVIFSCGEYAEAVSLKENSYGLGCLSL